MNTVKGIATAAAASPSARRALMGLFLGCSAVIYAMRRSGTLWILMLLLALLLEQAYFLHDWFLDLAPRLGCPVDVIWRRSLRQPLAALTIDDVPLLNAPSTLEEILDVLKENNVRASLMIMSGFDLPLEQGGAPKELRAKYRALLARAVSEGHELGNHLQFDRPAIAMPPEDFDSAFDHCDRLIAELSGGAWSKSSSHWFRPASALWNRHMLTRARAKGYTTAIASCYPHDVAAVTRFFNSFYLRCRVRPGAIIAVHDRWHTAETLRKALPRILKSGMRLGTLSELEAAYEGEMGKSQ